MRAKNYRSIRGQLYTRDKYIRGAPQPRITKFDMGNPNNEYEIEIRLNAEERALIRDRALESLRINVNRLLVKKLGHDNFHFKIKIHPHHVLRENKMMTGAGADRLQEGMRRAFGKPIGRAAAVDRGQTVAFVRTYKQFAPVVMRIMKIGASKLPKGGRVEVVQL